LYQKRASKNGKVLLVDNELYYSRDDNFEAIVEKDGRLAKMPIKEMVQVIKRDEKLTG
jgi:hypothetical protein